MAANKQVLAPLKSSTQEPRVLVTGATGFLGRHLVPALLERGYKVTCLFRGGDPGPGMWADCRMIQGDLRDPASLKEAAKEADAVVHAGAVIASKRNQDFDDINVTGTISLAEASRRAGVRHFIFISSVDVGHGTLYGQSKEKGEDIVKQSGMPYTILRPGPIYGPGDNKNIMELFDMVRTKRIVPVIGDGNYLRQPIHVDDAVESIIRSILNPRVMGKTYFLGGPSITYNEILSAMVEASDNRPTVVHLPAGLAKTLVMALNKFGLGPNVSADQVRTMDHDKIGDTGSFAKDTGFSAREFRSGFTNIFPRERAAAPRVHDGKMRKKKGRGDGIGRPAKKGDSA